MATCSCIILCAIGWAIQSRLARMLTDLVDLDGEGVVEMAIETSMGVKVPEVVWISDQRWSQMGDDAEASPVAGEVCVEVLSGSNTPAELEEKKRLFFECGALEVWTCSAQGRIRFFGPSGVLEQSDFVPAFPRQIDV